MQRVLGKTDQPGNQKHGVRDREGNGGVMNEWTSPDGRIRLINADCLAVLPELEAGSVDAVVTDPPYGVGFKYESHDDTADGYGAFLWGVIEQAELCVVDGGVCMVWQAAKHVNKFHQWFPRNYRLLIAAKSFSQVLPGPVWPAYEPVVTWWKGEAPKQAFGKCGRDFFLADTTPSGMARRGELVNGHPCPRPIQHAKWLVSTWTPPGGMILDPFGGSATTAVACIGTDRRCIAIEKERKYWEIGVQRCKAEYARTVLFNEAEAVA
jgi:DNA modification methylase